MTNPTNPTNPTYIYFYSNQNIYYPFSNFYPTKFIDSDDVKYCCSEQYFMKKKQELFDPTNITLGNQIMGSKNPKQIKKYGRLVKNFDENIWKENRYQIMSQGIYYKFSQNEELKQLLVRTADAIIAEASPTDRIWGIGLSIEDAVDGKKWKGLNLLGKALMDIRTRL